MPGSDTGKTASALKDNAMLAVARNRAIREQAQAEYRGLLRAAKDAGATWPEIAEAAGVTPRAAMWAAKAGEWGSTQERRAEASVRVRKAPAQRPKPDSPGMSVIEVAELLSLTRKAVYDRIQRGDLEVTRDAAGHLRVLGVEAG